MRIELKNITEQVCEVARRAGGFIAQQRKVFSAGSVEYKGEQNLVSYVDRVAEAMIVEELQGVLPGAGIIAEEGYSDFQQLRAEGECGAYRWIIDPLDGTTNFIHGMPPYCVSIALVEGDEDVVVAVIYEVSRDECFSAYKGGECWLNGEVVRVSEVSEVRQSLVITGAVYDAPQGEDSFQRAFNYFNTHTNGTRRLGSAAANMAYVAAGRAECFFQRGLSPWDVAAGVLLVRCAGGAVTNYSGGSECVFAKEIIATNNIIHNKFVEIICENSF